MGGGGGGSPPLLAAAQPFSLLVGLEPCAPARPPSTDSFWALPLVRTSLTALRTMLEKTRVAPTAAPVLKGRAKYT